MSIARRSATVRAEGWSTEPVTPRASPLSAAIEPRTLSDARASALRQSLCGSGLNGNDDKLEFPQAHQLVRRGWRGEQHTLRRWRLRRRRRLRLEPDNGEHFWFPAFHALLVPWAPLPDLPRRRRPSSLCPAVPSPGLRDVFPSLGHNLA